MLERSRPAAPPPHSRRNALVAACLLLIAFHAPPSAHAGTGDTKAECFAAFQKAWQSADAAAVVACMDAKGTVRVDLLLPQGSSGRKGWTAQQAKKSLQSYFKKIRDPNLKDVTRRLDRKPKVHLYDYAYRPVGQDATKTRLTVSLTETNGKWVLSSVIESKLPPK